MSVPKLRFGEFDGDLSNTSIGEHVSNFVGGASLTPSDFVSSSGFEVIPKKAISSGGKLLLEIRHPTYCSENFYQSNQRNIVDKSYLITTLRDLVPSGPSIGYIVKYENDRKYLLAQGVYGFKLKTELDKSFLIQFSNTLKFRLHMQAIMVGSTQVHIRNKDFFDTKIFIPSLKEQTKIANFLSIVDEKISQLTQKHELLSQYKQGMMQKLFSQQIRFKADDSGEFGDWEEKKFKEVILIKYGKDHKKLKSGDIPVLGTGGVMRYVDSYLYNGESILIGRKGTIDKPIFISGKFWTVDTLFYTEIGSEIIPRFAYQQLLMINWLKLNEATGVPSLNTTSIGNIDLKIPCLEEQTKIANFLSAIDQKIEVVAQQIEQAKTWKKGLLQQMFI